MKTGLAVVWLGLATQVSAAELRQLEIDREKGVYHVHSISYVDAPLVNVYGLLADYDHFNRISNVFVESRFIEPLADGTPRAFTRAKGCLLFFCMTIDRVDSLQLQPPTHIVAVSDPDLSDLDYGYGEWFLSAEGDGTIINFRQDLDPAFWIPPLLGPFFIKHSLRNAGEKAISRIEFYARLEAGLPPVPPAVANED